MHEEPADTLEFRPCGSCGRRNPSDAVFCNGCGRRLAPVSGSGTASAPVEASEAQVADPLVGRLVAERYRIVQLLGRGGMGVVYKAEHVHIGKLVALKLLHGELGADPTVARRFRREAEAASRLSSPHTVQIFDYGESDGLVYIAMEYIEGEDLGVHLDRERALPYPRAARICAQVAASVAEAHAVGIVHRDLKPENVMCSPVLGHPDFVKVLDFGLAKLREEDTDALTLTRAGHIVGTPYYMAPEQIRGEEVDPRTDVYALGAILYKCVAGVPPFVGSTPMSVLTKHLTDEVVPLGERLDGIPRALDAIVLRALAKEPTDRFGSAAQMRDALLAMLSEMGEDLGPAAATSSPDGTPPPMQLAPGDVATRRDVDDYERRLRKRSRWGGLAVVLLLGAVAAGGWYAWKQRPPPAPSRFEQEPNDTPARANELPPDWPVEAFLGRRLSPTRSDADVYLVRRPDESTEAWSLRVDAIPNMDIVVDVVPVGQRKPLLVLDTGGRGEPERAPNLPFHAPAYYVRVREKWVEGQLATENVSDPYVVSWRPVPPDPDTEREFNDSLEHAGELPGEGRRVGWIGWRGDLDIYCFQSAGGPVSLTLTPPPRLDLRMRLVDRDRAVSRTVDRAPLGAPERQDRFGPVTPRHCVEVSVSHRSPRPAEPTATYELRVQPAAGSAP